MHGAVSKGAPEQRFILGWTYVARGSALLALPIQPPGEARVGRAVPDRSAGPPAACRRASDAHCAAAAAARIVPIRRT